MAMAFAVTGLRVPGLTILEPGCTAKTFPDFWQFAALTGGACTSAGSRRFRAACAEILQRMGCDQSRGLTGTDHRHRR